MKATLPILGLLLVLTSAPSSFAQAGSQGPGKTISSNAEQEVITLSNEKWRWMAERNVEALDKLFAEEAVFVHMGGTMSKSRCGLSERRPSSSTGSAWSPWSVATRSSTHSR